LFIIIVSIKEKNSSTFVKKKDCSSVCADLTLMVGMKSDMIHDDTPTSLRKAYKVLRLGNPDNLRSFIHFYGSAMIWADSCGVIIRYEKEGKRITSKPFLLWKDLKVFLDFYVNDQGLEYDTKKFDLLYQQWIKKNEVERQPVPRSSYQD